MSLKAKESVFLYIQVEDYNVCVEIMIDAMKEMRVCVWERGI